MLRAVEGMYKHGSIELLEPAPPDLKESRVIITFLEKQSISTTSANIYFGMFAGVNQSTEQDFSLAEFQGDPDDSLSW